MFTIFERRSIATAHKLRINSRACKEYVLILAHIGSTILSDELCFADDLYVPWYVKKWTTIFLVIKMRTALEKLFDLFDVFTKMMRAKLRKTYGRIHFLGKKFTFSLCAKIPNPLRQKGIR